MINTNIINNFIGCSYLNNKVGRVKNIRILYNVLLGFNSLYKNYNKVHVKNKYSLLHENQGFFPYKKTKYIDFKRYFSSTKSMYTKDSDKNFEWLSKIQKDFKEHENFLKDLKDKNISKNPEESVSKKEETANNEVEKEKEKNVKDENPTFLDRARDSINELMNKQDEIEKKLDERIEKGYEDVDEKTQKEVDKYSELLNKEYEKVNNKAENLEKEYEHPLKPVSYFQEKVNIEAASFKTIIQIKERQEQKIDDAIKKKALNEEEKKDYEEDRSKWKEEHVNNIKECRLEKKQIKEHITSNLEKPSELAEDLGNEGGPDCTGED